MTQAGETKRQNFNVTPEQEAQIEWLREAIGAASAKETILRAVSVLSALKEYTQKGFKLALLKPDEQVELVIPGLQPPNWAQWKYLVERPHPWRRQLYVKGRRLLASTVWQDMLANELSLDGTAENFSLPVDAVVEIVRYCETNQELLKMEADEERRRLEEKGVTIEPKPARG
jgi:hypothetical protein